MFIRRSEIQEMRKKTAELEKKSAELEGEINRYQGVQELLVKDILTLQEIARGYKGNEYQEYEEAVNAIADKYNNKAEWGCTQTGTIIDLRAAFILGEGVQIKHRTRTRKEAERELQWAADFFEFNGLDSEMAQEIAKEAEIEGKIAIRLLYDANNFKGWPGMVSARYISWLSKKYKVKTDSEDYFWYKKIKWDATGTLPAGEYDEPAFVYKKFGGRISNPDEAQPKIMKCLTIVDRLDKALRDLREIDHLFATPTPDFECETTEQVKSILKYIEEKNWKIGKAIAHTGKFSLKGPDSAGVQNLINEIELCVKMISGTTGIPIHFLGLLDLLKNRATGDNTRELVMAATTRERMTWVGAFEELITKGMTMFNEESQNTKLDPTKIKIIIPLITQEHWDRIEKVLIPAALGGIVSKEHVASQIPGVDAEAEAEKRKQRDIEDGQRMENEYKMLKAKSEEVV